MCALFLNVETQKISGISVVFAKMKLVKDGADDNTQLHCTEAAAAAAAGC